MQALLGNPLIEAEIVSHAKQLFSSGREVIALFKHLWHV
jgi:hypothetical protein